MKSICKYELTTHDITYKIPKGYLILSVKYNAETQKGVVYCLVPKYEKEMEDVRFVAYGTGWDIARIVADELEFIGTIDETEDGSKNTWHVFKESR